MTEQDNQLTDEQTDCFIDASETKIGFLAEAAT